MDPDTDSDFSHNEIGNRLRWLIVLNGVTQCALAEAIGVTQSAISNLVTSSSRKPNVHTLLSLVRHFNVSPWWLIYGEGEPFEVLIVTDHRQMAMINNFKDLPREKQDALIELTHPEI